MKVIQIQSNRARRQKRIRAKISGTGERPRLAVFKSNKAIYAQVIDDTKANTLAQAYGTDAKSVGAEVAKALLAKSIDQVVFDRGGYIYTGKVRDLADAAREAGLKF